MAWWWHKSKQKQQSKEIKDEVLGARALLTPRDRERLRIRTGRMPWLFLPHSFFHDNLPGFDMFTFVTLVFLK